MIRCISIVVVCTFSIFHTYAVQASSSFAAVSNYATAMNFYVADQDSGVFIQGSNDLPGIFGVDLNEDPDIGEYQNDFANYGFVIVDGLSVLSGDIVSFTTTVLNDSAAYGDLLIFEIETDDFFTDASFVFRLVLRDSTGTAFDVDHVINGLSVQDFDPFTLDDIFSTGLFVFDEFGAIDYQHEISSFTTYSLPVPGAVFMFVPALGMLVSMGYRKKSIGGSIEQA